MAFTATQPVNLPFGAGLTQLWRRQEKTFVIELYPQLFLLGDGGIGGQTTGQTQARSQLAYAVDRRAIEDVIALGPDVCFFRSPSINDLIGFTAPITQANIDGVIARLKQMIDQLCDAGIYTIDMGSYGYSGPTNQAQVAAAVPVINAALKAYNRSNYKFVDMAGIFYDPATGNYLPGISADGTHLFNAGGLRGAQAEAAALTAKFGVSTGSWLSGTNLIPNADLSAFTGNVGTGWTTPVANATIANQKIETVGGVKMQTAEFTPTAVGGNGSIAVPFTISGASPPIALVGGQKYGIEFDFYFGGLAGTAPPAGTVEARLIIAKTGTIYNLYSPIRYNWNDAYPEAVQGRVVFDPWIMPDFGGDPAAGLNAASTLRLQFAGAVGSDRTPFKVGVGNPRLVAMS